LSLIQPIRPRQTEIGPMDRALRLAAELADEIETEDVLYCDIQTGISM